MVLTKIVRGSTLIREPFSLSHFFHTFTLSQYCGGTKNDEAQLDLANLIGSFLAAFSTGSAGSPSLHVQPPSRQLHGRDTGRARVGVGVGRGLGGHKTCSWDLDLGLGHWTDTQVNSALSDDLRDFSR